MLRFNIQNSSISYHEIAFKCVVKFSQLSAVETAFQNHAIFTLKIKITKHIKSVLLEVN